MHISAHMFFEKTEVKQKWQGILNEFAFKSGANKKAIKINTTLNKRREEELKHYNDSFALGFVEKFVEVMRLRKKLAKVHSEIQANLIGQTLGLLCGEMSCITDRFCTSIPYLKKSSNLLWKKRH